MADHRDIEDSLAEPVTPVGRLPAPLVAALALFVALGALAFWLWWQDLRHPLATPPHGAVAEISRQAAPPQPAPSATVAVPQEPPPPATSAPNLGKVEPPAPAPPAPVAPAPAPTAAKPAEIAKPTETAKPVEPAKPPVEPAKPPPQVAMAPPAAPKPPPAAEPAAPAQPETATPLGPVPDPALIAKTPKGPLPIIAPDGRQAWQVYAKPFEDVRKRPRIAIVLGDMGLSQSATNTAIQQLPAAVTLAFAPYAGDLQTWIAKARAAGHEVMLQLPMEPLDYPANDPGPQALLTSLTKGDNQERLDWLLSRFTGYIGVTNYMGSKFTAAPAELRPILEEIKKRGLMFLDSRSSQRSAVPRLAREIGLPHATNSRFLDNEASRAAIDARLEELERIAKSTGTAVGMCYPYPVTIERIANWAAKLPINDFVLAPVSAVVNRQNIE